MSIDQLQDRIRKYKNPSIVEFSADISLIPHNIVEEEITFERVYERFCGELLESLKDIVPAVRFSFGSFALRGAEGLSVLEKVTRLAHDLGYYVLMDAPAFYAQSDGILAANTLLGADAPWYCDGVIVNAYIGADGVKPFADVAKTQNKTVFAVLRTGNKSASEVQELLTGARHVYTALADIVNRIGQTHMGSHTYSNVGCVCAASAPESLNTLRTKYRNQFILVEGYDYSNANAKNCSFAFDNLGHGAVVCAGRTITGAWIDSEICNPDYRALAVEAANRMKKNILRYTVVV